MALRVRLRDLLAEVLAAFAPAFHRHDVADVYGQTLTLGDEKTLTPGIQFCDLNYPPEPPRPGETVWVRDVCAPVSSEEN